MDGPPSPPLTSGTRAGTPYPEGLARLLDLIAGQMPREQVDAVWAFPGVRREGREYGVAVVSRRTTAETGDAGRRRVYRARYVLELKGEQRGRATLELEEAAETPADLLRRVIDGVARRADEAGDAELVDLAYWKAGDGHAAG